jgi:hypothetical protein
MAEPHTWSFVLRTRIICAVAIVDLVLTLPFALPFAAESLIQLIYRIDAEAGLGSAQPVGFGPLQIMFVHIMGVLAVLWAIARIRNPAEDLARLDALARLVVAALIIHAITMGATPLLWMFVATELLGSAAQFGRRRASA